MRGAVLLLTLIIVAGLWLSRSRLTNLPAEGQRRQSSRGESPPVCPWREPQQDLGRLFPGATKYVTETRILSEFMATINARLNRAMTVDENPLRIYRASDGTRTFGSVLVKRVKGEHGGIEIVIGIDLQGRVCGVLLQSQREPNSVAHAITNWLQHFVGKNAKSPLLVGDDLPDLSPEARASANAIGEGVRSGLIVFSFAENPIEAEKSVSEGAR